MRSHFKRLSSLLRRKWETDIEHIKEYAFPSALIDVCRCPTLAFWKWPKGVQVTTETILLDQGLRPIHLDRLLDRLRAGGWLGYHVLVEKAEAGALEGELKEALRKAGSRYRENPSKAVTRAVLLVEKSYEGDINNVYRYAKSPNEVWENLLEFYWFGEKKAGVFLRDMVKFGVWDVDLADLPIPSDTRVRRLLHLLGLIRDPNKLKAVKEAAKRLAESAHLTPLELDLALWALGDEDLCGERKAHCDICPLGLDCPSAENFMT